MRLTFCGVRGSTPAPGADFIRYGGETSCVAIAHDGQQPTLVLDGGTGLRNLTRGLDGAPFKGTILLGHLHWDHTHGLPFFKAGDRPDASVRVMLPAQGDPTEVLDRVMSPPHFPVRLQDLRGNWSLESIEEGTHELEGFQVQALEIPHKNSRTFGYRVSDGHSSIAYMSDHWPAADTDGNSGLGVIGDNAMRLAEGVDLLIHDAQYTAAEYAERKSFGHTAIEMAIEFAQKAGARQLALFHHDPDRTDDALDEIVKSHEEAPVSVRAAIQGEVINL